MFDNFYIMKHPDADLRGEIEEIIRFAEEYSVNMFTDDSQVDKDTLVISLGGDGTFLHAARLAAVHGAHVIGFNFGRLGFLTSETSGTLWDDLRDIVHIGFSESDYVISTRPVLQSTLNCLKKKDNCGVLAINEYYIAPENQSTSIQLEVYVDDVKAIETIGSGVVVATPTGSTAMSLSAGGSILAPTSNVFQITPILPHTLASRPLIVSNTSTIKVKWVRGDATIFADGVQHEVHTDSKGQKKHVTITKAEHELNIVQHVDWNFYENLRNKMSWNK